jgi:hypothetical protein
MADATGQGRSLQDVQAHVEQLLNDFPEAGHRETHGVLGLVAAMLSQVRVECGSCGSVNTANGVEERSAQLLDFAAAHEQRQREKS